MRQDLYIMIVKKKTKGIYGSASMEEVKELKAEGIDTEIIPWFNQKDN